MVEQYEAQLARGLLGMSRQEKCGGEAGQDSNHPAS
jgi:hypothetical protein